MLENNLFNYATKELSQDAFICWLLSYAKKDSKEDVGLRECAVNFIKRIIPELSCCDNKVFVTEKIKQQHENTDILFVVNNKYVVIIENKTYTSASKDQLIRYAEAITNDEYYRMYGKPIKVYYKTWFIFDRDLYEVKKAGYQTIDLINIVEMFAPFAMRTENQIFLDYVEYWTNAHNRIMEYKSIPVKQWQPEHIFGFYRDFGNFLENHGVNAYFKEDNRPGGDKVQLMYFNNGRSIKHNRFTCTVYLQLEFKEGNFKICLKTNNFAIIDGDVSNERYRTLINHLIYLYDEDGIVRYAFADFGFVKPLKLGL